MLLDQGKQGTYTKKIGKLDPSQMVAASTSTEPEPKASPGIVRGSSQVTQRKLFANLQELEDFLREHKKTLEPGPSPSSAQEP